MTFTNRATLSYNGHTAASNAVTGEVTPPLSLSKSAAADYYVSGGALRYSVTVVNSSGSDYAGLTLLDNLGQYDWEGSPRFPLLYTENSAVLSYYSGTAVTAGTAAVSESAAGVAFTFDLPAGVTAILTYGVTVTGFAPLSSGSSITNTATLSGDAPQLPLTSQYTLPALTAAQPTLTKGAPDSAVSGQPLTFTFTISNYGAAPVLSTDYAVLSDTFSPPLTGVAVYANGELWTEGTQYLYNEALYFFQIPPGVIDLPPASFSQNSFGAWTVTPSSLVIKVTGTVA